MSAPGSERIGLHETLWIFRRSLRYAQPFLGRFAIKSVLTLIAVFPSVLVVFPMKVVVDHVVLGTPLDQLFAFELADRILAPLQTLSRDEVLYVMVAVQLALVFLFGISGSDRDLARGQLATGQDEATRSENKANEAGSYSGGLFGLFDFRYMLRLSQDLNHYYRSSLFRRLQTLPMSALDDARIGDAVYRVMYDTPEISNLAYRVLLTPIAAPIQIAVQVTALTLLFPGQTALIWIAVAFFPLSLLVTLPFSGSLRRTGMRSRNAGAATTATLEEGMSNVLAVQSLGAGALQKDRFTTDSWRSFARYRGFVLVRLGWIGVATLAGAALGTAAFVEITDAVIVGALSPGDVAVAVTLFMTVLLSASSLGSLWVDLQGSAPGLQRVFFLLDQPSEDEAKDARVLPAIERGIELCDVDFDYPDGTEALRDVRLRIPVGSVTALCGPAGAGKTTLAHLIPRFISPTRGVVRADGVDLKDVQLASLRSQIALVSQENVFFDASVAENIRIANLGASDVQVRRAAQMAGAHEFIARLPQGYDTRLGRNGGTLSVGQKQRLSIARALVRDAKVLILDEPTSALDPETEAQLVAALRDASRERAVLVIAHRLSTIRGADQIAFLHAGRVLECGSHMELLQRRGDYARFVELQARGAA